MIENYIEEYCDGFEFSQIEHFSQTVSGIDINIDIFEAWKEINGLEHHREKAFVTLTKGEKTYECMFYEEHSYEHSFFPVTLKGKSCLLFRKTLYGFTLLDTDTLTETYNYMPENIKNGEESFIITGVNQLGELLIFDGCYWAAPYECYVYDYEEKLFANVSTALGVDSLEEIRIKDGTLYLSGDVFSDDDESKSIQKTISVKELNRLISENGVKEI